MHRVEQPAPLISYTSGTGNCIHALPKHVHRMVGHIPTIATPMGWDTTYPKDSIVATDGSFLFCVRYHSWEIATADEDILLKVGGPGAGWNRMVRPLQHTFCEMHM
jgi:hypothetical protein